MDIDLQELDHFLDIGEDERSNNNLDVKLIRAIEDQTLVSCEEVHKWQKKCHDIEQKYNDLKESHEIQHDNLQKIQCKKNEYLRKNHELTAQNRKLINIINTQQIQNKKLQKQNQQLLLVLEPIIQQQKKRENDKLLLQKYFQLPPEQKYKDKLKEYFKLPKTKKLKNTNAPSSSSQPSTRQR